MQVGSSHTKARSWSRSYLETPTKYWGCQEGPLVEIAKKSWQENKLSGLEEFLLVGFGPKCWVTQTATVSWNVGCFLPEASLPSLVKHTKAELR